MFRNDCCNDENGPRLGIGLRSGDVDAQHYVRLRELGRRLEPRAIDRHRLHHHRRGEMRGERERQAKDHGKLRTIGAGTQSPDQHLEPGAGNRLHRLTWFGRLKIPHQFHDILRKFLAGTEQRPPHRPRSDLIGSGRTTQPQIDPARMQCRKRAELLGNQQRSVIRQHDAAGADADAARAGPDIASATAVAALAMPGRL